MVAKKLLYATDLEIEKLGAEQLIPLKALNLQEILVMPQDQAAVYASHPRGVE